MGMFVESAPLGASRATMADSPRGQGRTPAQRLTEAPLGAASQWLPCYRRERSDRATWGAVRGAP
eukprot:8557695-Alexandrium_andersonii.AAC.1